MSTGGKGDSEGIRFIFRFENVLDLLLLFFPLAVAAMKNKMDPAPNIAIGSSTQVALFVAPVLVFASYLMPHGPMDLMFTLFEVLAVALAVGIVNVASQDGETHWLEGTLLLAVYAVIGIAFFFLPEFPAKG